MKQNFRDTKKNSWNLYIQCNEFTTGGPSSLCCCTFSRKIHLRNIKNRNTALTQYRWWDCRSLPVDIRIILPYSPGIRPILGLYLRRTALHQQWVLTANIAYKTRIQGR